ncbi:unnamed protein product [Dicrocoelium dendriticum]|nr:unnamed protein product [Dicrocoelium dendriticum]
MRRKRISSMNHTDSHSKQSGHIMQPGTNARPFSATLRRPCIDRPSSIDTTVASSAPSEVEDKKINSVATPIHRNSQPLRGRFLTSHNSFSYVSVKQDHQRGDYDHKAAEQSDAILTERPKISGDTEVLNNMDLSLPKRKIVVVIRKRPRNRREISAGDVDVVNIPAADHIVLCEPRQRVDLTEYLEHTTFRFDRCFDELSTTAEVYHHTAAPMISSIFQGYMATCFAYGQTGSGKTFTMGGPRSGPNLLPMVEDGVYGMVVKELFLTYEKCGHNSGFTISVNYFEIYCNKVYDLLNKKRPLRVMEDSVGSVQLVGLREYRVEDVQTALLLLRNGYQLRTNGQTTSNEHSSRSHAIFQINIRRRLQVDSVRRNNSSPNSPEQSEVHLSSFSSCSYPNPHYSGALVGRFSLVDLAGSERSVDNLSTSDRTRQLESGEINKSLLALKECIRAMGNRTSSYLPFRTSKLTQVLRESFVGKRSCTCMIATISPGLSCCENSMNTLRYAQRVKHLTPLARLAKPTYGIVLATAERFRKATSERGEARREEMRAQSTHSRRMYPLPTTCMRCISPKVLHMVLNDIQLIYKSPHTMLISYISFCDVTVNKVSEKSIQLASESRQNILMSLSGMDATCATLTCQL